MASSTTKRLPIKRKGGMNALIEAMSTAGSAAKKLNSKEMLAILKPSAIERNEKIDNIISKMAPIEIPDSNEAAFAITCVIGETGAGKTKMITEIITDESPIATIKWESAEDEWSINRVIVATRFATSTDPWQVRNFDNIREYCSRIGRPYEQYEYSDFGIKNTVEIARFVTHIWLKECIEWQKQNEGSPIKECPFCNVDDPETEQNISEQIASDPSSRVILVLDDVQYFIQNSPSKDNKRFVGILQSTAHHQGFIIFYTLQDPFRDTQPSILRQLSFVAFANSSSVVAKETLAHKSAAYFSDLRQMPEIYRYIKDVQHQLIVNTQTHKFSIAPLTFTPTPEEEPIENAQIEDTHLSEEIPAEEESN